MSWQNKSLCALTYEVLTGELKSRISCYRSPSTEILSLSRTLVAGSVLAAMFPLLKNWLLSISIVRYLGDAGYSYPKIPSIV